MTKKQLYNTYIKPIRADKARLQSYVLQMIDCPNCLVLFRYIKYVIDEEAKKNCIEILRLPPYNCDLNSIEPYWAAVKKPIRDAPLETKKKVADLENLVREHIGKFTKEQVAKYVDDVMKLRVYSINSFKMYCPFQREEYYRKVNKPKIVAPIINLRIDLEGDEGTDEDASDATDEEEEYFADSDESEEF